MVTPTPDTSPVPSTPSTTPSTREHVPWSSAIAPNGRIIAAGDDCAASG
ncbi:MAG: hypothetical protein GDA48_13835 [Hormoscilla sp. GM102CHS1]|nr:hypothetical protein [Hormoscilla sp. GM102CHS1]